MLENIDKELNDGFEITEPTINIISFVDLMEKIDYQFSPMVQCPLDQNDYMKWFAINALNVPKEEFPESVPMYINEDNRDDYENFMNSVERCFKRKLGIMFNDEEHRFNNVYNMYYFMIVNPESIITDYLLDYHFYKPGYDFRDVYYKNKTPNIQNSGALGIDPIEVISAAKSQYVETRKKEFDTLSYKERFDVFMNYTKLILLDETEFKFYNFFQSLNEYAPCDNYEYLDDEMNILLNISYEEESLITRWFLEIIMNEQFRETYINKKIIIPFFKQINAFEVEVNSTLN